MPNVTFTNTILRNFGRDLKTGKAGFTASLTNHVCKAMEWSADIPDCLAKASPEGELIASSVELVPEQKDLAKQAVSLGASQVNGFEIVRRELEGSRGKGHRLEVRFTVNFQDADGCRRLEQYLMTIGQGKGKLNISYQHKPKQEQLISDEQAADTTRED